jgi:hypothetical protein
VRRTLGENPLRRDPHSRMIELAQHLYQQNIQNVARPVLPLRPGAGVQLLRHLFVDSQPSHLRRHWQTYLGKPWNRGCDQVHLSRLSWAEIDIHRLPGAGSVLHRNLDAHRVGKFHFMDFWFQPERKFVERQLQYFSQPSYSLHPVALDAQVKISRRASRARETQFHRHSTFEVVRVDHTPLDRLLQHPANRQKRNPSSQAFLIEALLAGDTGERFLQTF